MSEILNQIRSKRHRASVPARIDELLEERSESSPTGQSVDSIRQEIAKYPEIIRHSAIRLDKDLDARLTSFCKENKCTIETFLEAAFEIVEKDPEMRLSILQKAQSRYIDRKRVGKLRQLLTQLEKTGF